MLVKESFLLIFINYKSYICNFFTAPVRPFDIAFAVDSSASITGQQWNYILSYLKGFISSFPKVSADYDGARFGLITYANQPRVYFTFGSVANDQINVAGYNALVGKTPRQKGSNRRIDSAIKLAMTGMFAAKGGVRANSRRVSFERYLSIWILKTCAISTFLKLINYL